MSFKTGARQYGAGNRHHELSEISHSLKHLAGQVDLTVVLLSQLNRECEKEKQRPQPSDLKETGGLKEDADAIVFIHRPKQYNRTDPALRGMAQFILAKHRSRPIGMRPMLFQPEFRRFVETTERGEDEWPGREYRTVGAALDVRDILWARILPGTDHLRALVASSPEARALVDQIRGSAGGAVDQLRFAVKNRRGGLRRRQ